MEEIHFLAKLYIYNIDFHEKYLFILLICIIK
jgi:hypothetical protein